MTWTIKVTRKAAKALKALDAPTKNRIENFIDQLAETDNPKRSGKALQGGLKGYWRYRIGDYRLICKIENQELIILILDIDHRKDIYR